MEFKTRKECYSYIKENNLNEEFKKKYYISYTNATTQKLICFCYASQTKKEKVIETYVKPQKEIQSVNAIPKVNIDNNDNGNYKECIAGILAILKHYGFLNNIGKLISEIEANTIITTNK